MHGTQGGSGSRTAKPDSGEPGDKYAILSVCLGRAQIKLAECKGKCLLGTVAGLVSYFYNRFIGFCQLPGRQGQPPALYIFVYRISCIICKYPGNIEFRVIEFLCNLIKGYILFQMILDVCLLYTSDAADE